MSMSEWPDNDLLPLADGGEQAGWPDEELVAAATGGDEARRAWALEEIRRKYGPLVERHVRRYLWKWGCRCPGGDRAEPVHDAWVLICRRIQQVETSLPGWLDAVCKSAASAHVDKCRRDRRVLSQPDDSRGEAAEGELTDLGHLFEKHLLLRRLLEEARNIPPPSFGEIFRLFYEERMTTGEIAGTLGRPEDAVRQELTRGRRRLILRLQSRLNGGNGQRHEETF